MKTNRPLYISAGLNVLLLGLGHGLFTEPTNTQPQAFPTVPPKADQVFPRSDAAAPAKFQWQQLESDDYPTYISNLRNVGVPEQTLSHIVTAEIAADYESKRQEIAAQPATTEVERAQRRQILDRLPQEQAAVISGLLGRKAAAPDPASYLTTGAELGGSENASVGEVAAAYPAVLVPADPAVPLTPRQVAEWEKLQQNFVAEVGGPGQSPNDPDYGDRWILAQRLSDELFRLKFGTQAFLRQNAEAGRVGATE